MRDGCVYLPLDVSSPQPMKTLMSFVRAFGRKKLPVYKGSSIRLIGIGIIALSGFFQVPEQILAGLIVGLAVFVGGIIFRKGSVDQQMVSVPMALICLLVVFGTLFSLLIFFVNFGREELISGRSSPLREVEKQRSFCII